MANNRENLLAAFEVRISDLIAFCEKLKEENRRLQEALSRKETEAAGLIKTIAELNARYDNLLTARVVAGGEDDLLNARQRLSELVREVDKCIALLNE